MAPEFRNLLIGCLTLFCWLPLKVKAEVLQSPLLWQIEGASGGHLLLGSIHLLPPTAYPLPAVVEAAYRSADTLVLETDPAKLADADLQRQLLAAGLSHAGLKSEIPEPLYARLKDRAAAAGLAGNFCDRFTAWFCALTLEIGLLQREGYSPEHGVDLHFFERATADGLELRWLEEPEQQLELFTALPLGLAEQMLESTLIEIERENLPGSLADDWLSGNEAAFLHSVQDMRRRHPQLYERLLADRNRAWVESLQPQLQGNEQLLIVVGAAHLVGPDALPLLLRQRGFRLDRVVCTKDGPVHALCASAAAPMTAAPTAAAP